MSSVHDQCKRVVEFHNHLTRFLSVLKKTMPEMTKRVSKCYKYYKSVPREKYIKSVIELMQPHIKHISEYDEGIFSDDYKTGKLCFIVGLDFKQVFNIIESDDFEDELRDSTKKHIFNHLQSIYVSAELAVRQVTDFNAAMVKQKEFLINMLKNVNLDEQLKEKLEKIANEESDESGFGMDSLKQISEIFDEDNFISKLAKDVTEELELGNGRDNPVESITDLFANNGEKLQELLIKIGDKIEEKIQTGEITQEQLVDEATKMKNKVTDAVGDLPIPMPSSETDPRKFYEAEYQKLDNESQEKYAGLAAVVEKDNETWSEDETNQFQEFVTYCLQKSATSMMSGLASVAVAAGAGAGASSDADVTE